MSDERPQIAYHRAIEASIAHEAAHAAAWRIPCRTCQELREAEQATLDAIRRDRR
jgi:hypothetical protein